MIYVYAPHITKMDDGSAKILEGNAEKVEKKSQVIRVSKKYQVRQLRLLITQMACKMIWYGILKRKIQVEKEGGDKQILIL